MLADILKKDIRQYAARGIAFDPADIVRLNALAVKVKLCQHPCQGVHLPRVCFLPRTSFFGNEIALREPTIAHELWLEEAARWIDITDERNFFFLHGYALSIFDPDKLPDVFAPKKLIRRVYRFAAKQLVRYTLPQLRDAIDYVLYGADWTMDEKAIPKPPKDVLDGRSPDNISPTLGILANARSLGVNVSLEDAKRMTASELDEAISEALVRSGEFDRKLARNEAMGDYVRTRDAIVERIQRGKEAGNAS